MGQHNEEELGKARGTRERKAREGKGKAKSFSCRKVSVSQGNNAPFLEVSAMNEGVRRSGMASVNDTFKWHTTTAKGSLMTFFRTPKRRDFPV